MVFGLSPLRLSCPSLERHLKYSRIFHIFIMNNMRLSTKKGTRSDLQGVPYTRHILEYSSGDARYVTATAYSQAANHILDLSYLVLLMS